MKIKISLASSPQSDEVLVAKALKKAVKNPVTALTIDSEVCYITFKNKPTKADILATVKCLKTINEDAFRQSKDWDVDGATAFGYPYLD